METGSDAMPEPSTLVLAAITCTVLGAARFAKSLRIFDVLVRI
jgi:hypothetical protein